MSAQSRVRPGDPGWPSDAEWAALSHRVGGRLIRLESPLAICGVAPESAACRDTLDRLNDPYFLGDEPALSQASGYLDAWTAAPGAFAVAAAGIRDVVAAVEFARSHNLRLVVKGGGHSYQGTSSAPDSLVIWTRAMNDVELHDEFIPARAPAVSERQPAVSVGAGAIWMSVYNAVTTRAGRYVQGGGCMTVGVAGIIQSGGFGSFSKAYGLAAAGLLEAEVVTADGVVRTVSAHQEPDLFWALKGGGGGNFGVVTRLTLRTRELPESFGGVNGTVRASSETAFKRLVDRILGFYRERLFNSHWGEQIRFAPDNTVRVGMVHQGLTSAEAVGAWQPLLDWLAAAPGDFEWAVPLSIGHMPASHFWDSEVLLRDAPGRIVPDERPGAREGEFFWAGNQEEAGQFLYGYHSAWLPAKLLEDGRRAALTEALVAACRHWEVELHFNKGLAGARSADVAAAADTAINPSALHAFALAVTRAIGPPAYPGMPGPGPDLSSARRKAAAVNRAMGALLRIVPDVGSYVSESDFFERDWQRAFWGSNYARLARVKRTYDPEGVFITHHGVGSEEWSADGFVRRLGR